MQHVGRLSFSRAPPAPTNINPAHVFTHAFRSRRHEGASPFEGIHDTIRLGSHVVVAMDTRGHAHTGAVKVRYHDKEGHPCSYEKWAEVWDTLLADATENTDMCVWTCTDTPMGVELMDASERQGVRERCLKAVGLIVEVETWRMGGRAGRQYAASVSVLVGERAKLHLKDVCNRVCTHMQLASGAN